MTRMKVVVVDDNATRREQIKSLLPDYMDVIVSGYGNNAMSIIKSDAAGVIPDLVILNGDDSKGLGLYTFDWMINKSGKAGIADIPVIVLCQDEFSNRCLDFLEIGDVSFYEGEIDEDSLFAKVTEVIDGRNFLPEPIEASYEEEKSIDRLIGQKVRVTPSISGKERKVVLDVDTQLANLEAALNRGRKRAEEIRRVLNAAQDGNDKVLEYALHRRKKSSASSASGDSSGFLRTLKKEHGMSGSSVEGSKGSENYFRTGFGCLDADIPEEFRYKSDAGMISELHKKAVANPTAAINAQEARIREKSPAKDMVPAGGGTKTPAGGGTQNPAGYTGNVFQNTGVPNQTGSENRYGSDFSGQVVKQNQKNSAPKRRVVIVEDDPRVTSQCSMALSTRYEVVCFNSGMMAIDYFIRNTANLLIIDAVMPGMSGKQTVDSIRYQAGGARVPVIYMAGEDYQGPREMLSGNYIVGVLSKPVSRGALAMAVDGLFR